MTKRKTAPVHLRTPEKVTPTDPDYKPQTRQEAIRQVMAATIREIHQGPDPVPHTLAPPVPHAPGDAAHAAQVGPQNAAHAAHGGHPVPHTLAPPVPHAPGARDLPKETIRLPREIITEINILIARLGMTKQQFWEGVAAHVLSIACGTSPDGLVRFCAARAAHDDKKTKTHETIISSYTRFTAQPWTTRDDLQAYRFNDVDPRLIDIAMIQVMDRKLAGRRGSDRIKSFAYFVPEIETVLEQAQAGELPHDLAQYHSYAMSTWERRIKPIRNQKWRI